MPIMAPKVAFPAAFGILIGTCLFKILVPRCRIAYSKRGNYSSIGTTTLIQKLRPML